MTSFKVIDHVIPGQHIREYPNGTKQAQEDVLRLSIKQYIPLQACSPIPGNSITIIGVHGNGFPKKHANPCGTNRIRIWNHSSLIYAVYGWRTAPIKGASSVLNENLQGDDTSWLDHSRDLLHMVNHFRTEMPRPIIGFAHSMGCAQLVNLSIMYPRLLSSLILCEPVILDSRDGGPNPALMSTMRRDLWETRAKAEASLRKAFKAWDSRTVDLYLKYGLKAVPTALYDTTQDGAIPKGAVALTTSKHQEAWAYSQPNFEPQEAGLDRLLLPDCDPIDEIPRLYTRTECYITTRNLSYLRPSVLYIFRAKSPLSDPTSQEQKMKLTGSGSGGSGGVANKMVQKVTFPDYGHLLVFEHVREAARVSADWIKEWFEKWLEDETFYKGYHSKKLDKEMLRTSKAWLATVKMPNDTLRPTKGKL